MGEVCRAQDTTLGRDVALKVLHDALAATANRLPGRSVLFGHRRLDAPR
jgi:hypothetical protein